MNRIYFDMPMEEYLQVKAMSQGPLAAVVDSCPADAWFQSYLNPTPTPPEHTDDTDIGEVAHAMLLEGREDLVTWVDPADFPGERGGIPVGWTTKAIKEERQRIRESGHIPMFIAHKPRLTAIVNAAQKFIHDLRHHEPQVWHAFGNHGGESEVVVTWDDHEIPCKMRVDRMSADRMIFIDAKFTKLSVAPDRWARSQLVNMGYYFAAAHYRSGGLHAFGGEPTYLFLNQQVEPPYLTSLCGLSPEWEAIGAAKYKTAMTTWQRCVERNEFPGYPARVCYPDTPAWLVAQIEEQQIESGSVL
jgi:hypothetical protein